MRHLFALSLFVCAVPALADEYQGQSRLWFTLAAMPLQVSGGAGRAVGMERFLGPDAPALGNLATECYGWADDDGLGRGHCVTTAPNGDFWVESYVCQDLVLPPPGAFAACAGTSTVLGGTGQFAGMKGSGKFTMLTTRLGPDGLRMVYAPGEIDLRW